MTFYVEPFILIVDDDAGHLLVARRMLEKAGHRVITATSGTAALDAARALGEPLMLLITDLDMPDMTGRILVEMLRSQQPDLKVLYLTAHTDGLFDEQPVLGDDDAFLEKPVTGPALAEAVRLLLRRNTEESTVDE